MSLNPLGFYQGSSYSKARGTTILTVHIGTLRIVYPTVMIRPSNMET